MLYNFKNTKSPPSILDFVNLDISLTVYALPLDSGPKLLPLFLSIWKEVPFSKVTVPLEAL